MFLLLNLIKLFPVDVRCTSKLLSAKESQGKSDTNTGSDDYKKMLLIVASAVSNTGLGIFSFKSYFITKSLI